MLAAISEWRDELQATLQDEREIELPFDLADIDYTDIENSEVSEWFGGLCGCHVCQ